MKNEITGIVIKGEGYGRKIGYPTLNLELKEGNLFPPGIYAGEVLLDGKKYKAGIVLGPGKKAEAHLLLYSGDAYGKEATFYLLKFLRDFKDFENEEALKAQIKKDLEKC